MKTASPEELRELFLFEDLDDEKLAWLSLCGTVEEYPADGIICDQGERRSSSTCCWTARCP